MIMISDEYLDRRIDEWADWVARVDTNGLGFPNKSVEQRLREQGGVLISGTGLKLPPSNERAEEMERLIGDLHQSNPDLANALRAKYLTSGEVKQKAKRLGISAASFTVYVKMAKIWLAGRLSAN